MKKIFTMIAVALLAAGSLSAQTMTLTIEGKEVKNGDNVVVQKQVSDMATVVIPNILTKYDLHTDVVLVSNIAQTIELTGEDLEQDAVNHLACCPAGYTCTTANADNGYISSCTMANLSAGQKVDGKTFIHYGYKDNTDPGNFTRNARITLKGKSETLTFNITFVVGDVSGISNIAAETALGGASFNLAGQRVSGSQKGIVIMNGKKVVVK